MRKALIAGNWKMNGSRALVDEFFRSFKTPPGGAADREAVICPPFTLLSAAVEAVRSAGSAIGIGAQDVHWAASGAYTGEVSTEMLKDAGCAWCIIGHSERRAMFGETDQTVGDKLDAALAASLIPIVCVGETLEEREAGKMEGVVRGQVENGILSRSASANFERLTIAYEPVWAIGTGKTATDEQANEAIGFIRGLVRAKLGDAFADALRILYGGSVKPDNVDGLMAQPEIDGALVGGASLKPADFQRLYDFQK